MKSLTMSSLFFYVVLASASVFAGGRGDAQDLDAPNGVVNAWNTDFPVFTGVTSVKFSKSHASLMYFVKTENAPETVKRIAEFYKGKTIATFVVGDFSARDDVMPDSQGFSAGKKQRGKGLSIFLIPQGRDVVVYIHPFKK